MSTDPRQSNFPARPTPCHSRPRPGPRSGTQLRPHRGATIRRGQYKRRGSDPDRRSGGYAPSRSLRGPVSASELCCTFPGATTAVRACDPDHTTAYGAGGQTRRTNLKPLCRFHHRPKTFDIGRRDHQDPLGAVAFRAPTGHYLIGNADTGYDGFAELRPTIPDAVHPARTHLTRRRRGRVSDHARALDRWDRAPPPPFRRRRRRRARPPGSVVPSALEFVDALGRLTQPLGPRVLFGPLDFLVQFLVLAAELHQQPG